MHVTWRQKKVTFEPKSFWLITFYLRKIQTWALHHRVTLVETRRMMYSLTSKGQFENLTSGQGQARSWPDPHRSWCISIDAYWQDKRIGASFTVISSFNRELLIKNHRWPLMTSSRPEMTLQRPHVKIYTWVFNYGLKYGSSDRIGQKRRIWKFPHWHNGRVKNWPDLRSQISKFRDIRIVANLPLIKSYKS